MKAVIFDFDGTIADSAYVWDTVDMNFFKRRGMEIPPDYTDRISTLNMYDGAVFTKNEYSLPDSIKSIIKEWQDDSLYEYEHNVRLKPYAAEYIRLLTKRGIRIGLATSSSPEYYRPVLEKNGIYHLFDAFSDGSSGLRSKDFPDIFLHCAEQLGTSPEDCHVYEDILPAILSARAAGMTTTAVFEERTAGDWDAVKAAAHSSILSFEELVKGEMA